MFLKFSWNASELRDKDPGFGVAGGGRPSYVGGHQDYSLHPLAYSSYPNYWNLEANYTAAQGLDAASRGRRSPCSNSLPAGPPAPTSRVRSLKRSMSSYSSYGDENAVDFDFPKRAMLMTTQSSADQGYGSQSQPSYPLGSQRSSHLQELSQGRMDQFEEQTAPAPGSWSWGSQNFEPLQNAQSRQLHENTSSQVTWEVEFDVRLNELNTFDHFYLFLYFNQLRNHCTQP